MRRIIVRPWLPLLLMLMLAAIAAPIGVAAAPPQRAATTYSNPLDIQIPGDGKVESCADPSVFYDEQSKLWYMYCTTDLLNDQDRTSNGDFNFHLIPMMSSPDLINWTYEGDAFSARPEWAEPTAVQVTIPNRYEGPEVVFKDGLCYLFVSATNCCNGPLTGYSVFVGRSENPTGPFVDREGISLLTGRVGGTPVLSMNGNRWVGPGHNTVFEDFDGQWWTIYHAVDRSDPYFEGAVGFTKRPALLDALDWAGGWPTVRGGLWASDQPIPAPAAQPGQTTDYRLQQPQPDIPVDGWFGLRRKLRLCSGVYCRSFRHRTKNKG